MLKQNELQIDSYVYTLGRHGPQFQFSFSRPRSFIPFLPLSPSSTDLKGTAAVVQSCQHEELKRQIRCRLMNIHISFLNAASIIHSFVSAVQQESLYILYILPTEACNHILMNKNSNRKMLIFKCDSMIYIINVYETTIIIYTTRYVQYVLEHKLCAKQCNTKS